AGDGEAVLMALFGDPAVIVELDVYADEGRPIGQSLVAAARTRSPMGRADAFTKLAARMQGSARRVLLALAAEAYAAAGNKARAACGSAGVRHGAVAVARPCRPVRARRRC